MMVLRTLAIQILTYFYFALFLNLKKKFNERRRRICALSEASYENFYSILHYHAFSPTSSPPFSPTFSFHLFPRHFPHHFCGNFYSILHSHISHSLLSTLFYETLQSLSFTKNSFTKVQKSSIPILLRLPR